MAPIPVLSGMPYPGRAIIVGAADNADCAVIVYVVTGRSPASRTRRLSWIKDSLWTEPSDRAALKKGKADLLIYRALFIGRGLAVSNGRQTDAIARSLRRAMEGESPEAILSRALCRWSYEPDAPHFTPRIGGCVLTDGQAGLSIIRRSSDGSPRRSTTSWVLKPGRGKLISTYAGEELDPLPSFAGPPREVRIEEMSAGAMARAVYQSLEPREPQKDYRVGVACLMISLKNFAAFDVQVINRQER